MHLTCLSAIAGYCSDTTAGFPTPANTVTPTTGSVSVTITQTYTYTCENGYEYVGNLSTTCNSASATAGNWSNQTDSCTGIYCLFSLLCSDLLCSLLSWPVLS